MFQKLLIPILTLSIASCGGADSESDKTNPPVETNNAPIANAQTIELDEDTSVEIVLTGSDSDGDALTYSLVSMPENGVLTGEAPNLTYIPNENYFGEDSFVFKVSDGEDESEENTIELSIIPINDETVIELIDSLTLNEGEQSSLVANIIDIDDDNFTFDWVTETEPYIYVDDTNNREISFIAPEVNSDITTSIKFIVTDSENNTFVQDVSITILDITDSSFADTSGFDYFAIANKPHQLDHEQVYNDNGRCYELVKVKESEDGILETSPVFNKKLCGIVDIEIDTNYLYVHGRSFAGINLSQSTSSCNYVTIPLNKQASKPTCFGQSNVSQDSVTGGLELLNGNVYFVRHDQEKSEYELVKWTEQGVETVFTANNKISDFYTKDEITYLIQVVNDGYYYGSISEEFTRYETQYTLSAIPVGENIFVMSNPNNRKVERLNLITGEYQSFQEEEQRDGLCSFDGEAWEGSNFSYYIGSYYYFDVSLDNAVTVNTLCRIDSNKSFNVLDKEGSYETGEKYDNHLALIKSNDSEATIIELINMLDDSVSTYPIEAFELSHIDDIEVVSSGFALIGQDLFLNDTIKIVNTTGELIDTLNANSYTYKKLISE